MSKCLCTTRKYFVIYTAIWLIFRPGHCTFLQYRVMYKMLAYGYSGSQHFDIFVEYVHRILFFHTILYCLCLFAPIENWEIACVIYSFVNNLTWVSFVENSMCVLFLQPKLIWALPDKQTLVCNFNVELSVMRSVSVFSWLIFITAVDEQPLQKLSDQLRRFEEHLYHTAGQVLRVCVDVENVSWPCTSTGIRCTVILPCSSVTSQRGYEMDKSQN